MVNFKWQNILSYFNIALTNYARPEKSWPPLIKHVHFGYQEKDIN